MANTFSQFKELAMKDGAKLVTEGVKDTKGLAEAISTEMKSAGRAETEYDVQKNLEQKAASLETKANEIMHAGNAGYGAELVPGNVLSTSFLDLIPSASQLMGFFSAGYHGNALNMKQDVPVIGELALHQLKAEQTTGAFAFAQGTGRLPTAKVELVQKQRFFSVDISEHEQQFGITDVVALVKRKLALSAANTMVSDILNGDTATSANTNINLIDGTPTGSESYLAADGLRKQAVTDSTATDAGTLGFADYLTAVKSLGFLGANKQDLAIIHSVGAEVAALGVDEFRQAYVNGQVSSAITGKLPNFLGASIATERFLGEANTAGKISGTASNNVKGQIVVAHKSAVQWGTNGDYYMEIYRVPGAGYQVIGWYFMGHAIAGKAKLGTASVASLYNIS